jgi:hypothetical protein
MPGVPGIQSYTSVAASNVALFPEGMPPSSVNDSMRQVQKDIRDWYVDAEWVNWGDTPSRASATTFKIATDVTTRYPVHTRLKCYDASTIYSTVTAATYSAPDTTITVVNDSGSLTSSLSSVARAIISSSNISIPSTIGRKGSDIASATTTDIGAATADFVDVTGTTTITGLGTIGAGIVRVVRFTGALTLTHNATSLILPGGFSIVTQANDRATFRSLGSGNWICIHYERANGSTIPFGYKGTDIASAGTTDLSTATGDFVDVTGTTTITALGTAPAGYPVSVRFTGALTLTHNGTSLILPSGANITTAANDMARFRSLGSGNWICENYKKQDGTSVVGGTAAAQSDQETATSTTTYVTPGRQQFHPSACKMWLRVTYSAGTPTNALSYNVGSLTDTANGRLTINFTTAFSGATYCTLVSGETDAGTNEYTGRRYGDTAQATTSVEVCWTNNGGTLVDPREGQAACFGDQ